MLGELNPIVTKKKKNRNCTPLALYFYILCTLKFLYLKEILANHLYQKHYCSRLKSKKTKVVEERDIHLIAR